jgi:hypothetical protein
MVEKSKSGENLQDRTNHPVENTHGSRSNISDAALEDPYGTEDANEVAGVIEEAASRQG